MRASEFISEATKAKITKRQSQSTNGLNTFGDGNTEQIDGNYTAYRVGMAVAGANGKDPIDMSAESWIGKRKTAHPYTKEEQAMLKQAYKVTGAGYTDLNKGNLHSMELDDIHTTSPMMGFAGYGAKPKKIVPVKKK